jgi:hypothetical protein
MVRTYTLFARAIFVASLLICFVFSVVAYAQNPELNVYFGETHQHTNWSFDAYIFGNHFTGPADSYKYYLGETIKYPLGYDIRIDTPPSRWNAHSGRANNSGTDIRNSCFPESPRTSSSSRNLARDVISED